ncbi:alpha/beta fold hydrolase [Pengzhenrongella sicca]|uniref:Alpha/beta hydrolase n=1 Tax=Pengzhenrongella sicca TaxID=2819238 RepID=A0A8A4ZB61_9MICO|nr:alpha/beta hydrolase [Pengzhenrongella sicca]QTE29220.1 alpha/beta hydrolase [Pengzhenrongella sicca]
MNVDSSAVLLTGPWRHQFVPANAARFHVAVAGPDEREAPLVVLLHGFPQFWWAWRHQITALADAGYRVAAMDLRGTGASDKPPTGYDVPTLTRDVAGLIRSLGADRAVVVGHGLGGAVAWSMPALQPGVTQAVAALAAPHPLQLHASARGHLSPTTARHLAFFQLPYLPERALTHGDLVGRLLREWGVPGWLDDETLATHRTAARVPFAAHSAMERVRWLVRSTPRVDGRRYLAALRSPAQVPVLQLHGTSDRCLSAAHAVLPASEAGVAGPQYRFELVEHAGHFLPEEAPERVSELLIEWLAEVAPLVAPRSDPEARADAGARLDAGARSDSDSRTAP